MQKVILGFFLRLNNFFFLFIEMVTTKMAGRATR
jgi:hypothetical protein